MLGDLRQAVLLMSHELHNLAREVVAFSTK
jgi:hypothetical protein